MIPRLMWSCFLLFLLCSIFLVLHLFYLFERDHFESALFDAFPYLFRTNYTLVVCPPIIKIFIINNQPLTYHNGKLNQDLVYDNYLNRA